MIWNIPSIFSVSSDGFPYEKSNAHCEFLLVYELNYTYYRRYKDILVDK